MSRTTFFKNDKYDLSYEVLEEQLFIHITFETFSKAIFSEAKETWIEFLFFAYFEGFDFIYTYTKDPRIVNLLGGSVEVGQDNDNLTKTGVRMFRWDLR